VVKPYDFRLKQNPTWVNFLWPDPTQVGPWVEGDNSSLKSTKEKKEELRVPTSHIYKYERKNKN